MKKILISLLFLFCLLHSEAQFNDAPYRIFGEVTTVENYTYKGFITWGGVKNYWIDFFEANKMTNPYSSYFHASDGVFFYNNGRSFATPPTHVFNCRFGNLQSLTLTGENEIQLTLKNGEKIPLSKGNFSDINTSVQMKTPNEVIHLKWEYISEIRFMEADSNLKTDFYGVAGIVKSNQGIYKGLITWNYNKKQTAGKSKAVNGFLNQMSKIIRPKNSLELLAQKNLSENPFYLKPDLLYPMGEIMINMPNIGIVIVPPYQFKELNIISPAELNLLTYTDFTIPQAIQGKVITRNNGSISGKLAYDLDESMEIEILDGKNDNITYKIPFKYIQSIEPKNYKYSFITLLNGSHLSLGDSPDVSRENSGIIVFTSDLTTYIPWNEIKAIIFN